MKGFQMKQDFERVDSSSHDMNLQWQQEADCTNMRDHQQIGHMLCMYKRANNLEAIFPY